MSVVNRGVSQNHGLLVFCCVVGAVDNAHSKLGYVVGTSSESTHMSSYCNQSLLGIALG